MTNSDFASAQERQPSPDVESAPSLAAPQDEFINILIVDDEPKNLTVLETILDDPCYRLMRAESADQALLALVVEEFALLILDIHMPGMTGFELAQMIRARKKTAGVPIIFLTAYYNEDQHVLEGYDSGAVDYLYKPVNAAALRSKVAVFAELHRKQREVETANRTLLAEVNQRRRAEEELRELNDTLEQRVAERTQALHNADIRKNEFLATLAHELRNPLAPIRNAVQILQMSGVQPADLTWAQDVINRQVQQMARLIEELMDVSRINQGKFNLKRERVELAKMVQMAVETSRPVIDEYCQTLTVTLPSKPLVLNADLTRLAQAILNLLNNAAKFSPKGSSIDLTAECQGQHLLVSVADNGIGIPIDKLESVFEMFSQVENGLSQSHAGLGIGLCLVKRVVEMHGGNIEAQSKGLGQGSKFVIRLPLEEYSPIDKTSIVDDNRATLASQLRILVVDDNHDIASSLAMLLKLMGNNVRVAHDGAEAVEAAREYRPNVVVLDIGLPRMNGYEAARTIRQEQWGENMVIIAATGWGQDEDRRKTEEAGFDRHMVKPVDPQALMKVLAELQTAKT